MMQYGYGGNVGGNAEDGAEDLEDFLAHSVLLFQFGFLMFFQSYNCLS
jgi:hypothetical protein